MTDAVDRRSVLAALGAAAAGLAGCSSPEGGPSPPETTDGADADGTGDGNEPGDDDTTAGDRTATGTTEEDAETDGPVETETGTPEPDLREANVVDVEVSAADEDQYRFDVTLYHDDDGEEGYADWWQVETLDGERLGRRELAHAHSTDPFSRSETVDVPTETNCVVVRGHDQAHEYGGQAMVADVETGETAAYRQGADPDSFGEAACPRSDPGR